MDGMSLNSPALEHLHRGQEDLIDIINELDKYGPRISLPWIVVIGDRSSGKSSVLGAITGLQFPIDKEMGTKFPIEFHLRPGSSDQDVTLSVRVQSEGVSKQEDVRVDKSQFDNEGIPGFIQAAEKKLLRNGARLSEDAIVIDISGPGVPHLSLVDLPGFISSQDGDSQSATDQELLDRLMERYLTKGLILAVVSAQSAQHPIISQKLLSVVKRYDEDSVRTLGIITKSDVLISVIKTGDDFVTFLRGIDETMPFLAGGWHALRNRGETEVEDTDEHRDQKEQSLFQSSYWLSVLSKNFGAHSLRVKLNTILFDHARGELECLRKILKEEIAKSKGRLKQLGEPRMSTEELRTYLENLAPQFYALYLHALEGNYDDDFFGGLFPERGVGWFEDTRIRKLQAMLRDQSRAFMHVLKTNGSKRITLPKGRTTSLPEVTLPAYLQELADKYDTERPASISFAGLVAHLKLMLPAHQGPEFPGTSNDSLVIKMFREQAQPWEAIARRHFQLVLGVTEEFTKKLVRHITSPDQKTYSRIVSKIVEPFFEGKPTVLESKLQELLYHYKSGRLHVPDIEFATELRLASYKNRPFPLGTPAASDSSAEDIIDKSTAYYQMSLRIFMDNVIVLAVKNCLIKDLPFIMTSNTFKQMADDEIEQLASESPDIQEARQQLQLELGDLEETLEACLKCKTKTMSSMSLEPEGLLDTNSLDDHLSTALDDEPVTTPSFPAIPDSGDPSGQPSSSSWAEQQPYTTPEASTQTVMPQAPTSVAASGSSATANHAELCFSPFPTDSIVTAPVVTLPAPLTYPDQTMNICGHISYRGFSLEELRVYAWTLSMAQNQNRLG
ncbi:P-loop containing nucleoside triphosphate hydrolase protein [Hypoxylon sp. FL1284]|nr:P-loop containing nucleoside triphosphate hydrolase protein [Hypoxylon sp. FL1284]